MSAPATTAAAAAAAAAPAKRVATRVAPTCTSIKESWSHRFAPCCPPPPILLFTETILINEKKKTTQLEQNKKKKPMPRSYFALSPSQGIKARDINPDSKNVNLVAKVHSATVVVDTERKSDKTRYRIAEVVVGDDTGSVVLTAKNDQIDLLQPGNTVEIRNGKIDMWKINPQSSYIRLIVDKWGKINAAATAATFTVNVADNASTVEYELVNDTADAAAPQN